MYNTWLVVLLPAFSMQRGWMDDQYRKEILSLMLVQGVCPTYFFNTMDKGFLFNSGVQTHCSGGQYCPFC